MPKAVRNVCALNLRWRSPIPTGFGLRLSFWRFGFAWAGKFWSQPHSKRLESVSKRFELAKLFGVRLSFWRFSFSELLSDVEILRLDRHLFLHLSCLNSFSVGFAFPVVPPHRFS